MLWRVLRRRLAAEHPGNMPWLFFLAACAIPAFYAVGLIARTGDNFTTTEFWRFWVVHLWVEDFLELFTTVMVAYMFVLLGVVRERIALTVVFLDIVLYSVGGVVGTMHHLYFSGEPAEHMALGAFFSAAEVIPLTFLTVEAWSFLQLGAAQESRSQTPFPHRWAVMFLVAVGFWNFLGAGIFGFLINLPIVSYYEIGTALTANHGHAAMMGVYGMLALGLAMFCLRYLIPADRWPEKWARISLLVDEHRPGLDVLRDAAAARHPAALQVGRRRLLRGARAEVPDQRHEPLIEWLRLPGRHRLHRRRRAPGALHRLPRHPPHRQARHARRARRHPLHRDLQPAGVATAGERRGDGGEADMTPEVVLAAGYAGAAHRRRLRARVAVGAHAPALAALPHRRLHLRRGRTTTGSARRASTSGRTSSTTSAGSCATAPRRTSATRCPRKDACTDSDRGREIVRPLDPWPHSEAGRFHRAIALLMVALGAADPRRRGRAPPRAARGRRCWSRLLVRRRARRRAGCCATCAPTRPTSRTPTPSHGLRMVVTAPTGARRAVAANEALGGPRGAVA